MANNQSTNKDFLLGTIIGGVVGAATALLLAPKAGKELRADLNEQAAYVRLKTEQVKNNAVEKGQEFAQTAKVKTADLSQTISEQSSQVVDKVKNFRKADQHEDNLPPTSLEVLADEVESQSNEDFQQKLTEAQEALDEVESNINRP
ncbi:YtxH domain-containing protein [Priestia flexa]|jgi:gas vesicle protein|uniref:YtxH domain-containing protein n=1 Tax=Priestia flexa TaxID=86664 RepID=A0A8I1MD43_9BACI|nr:YtxH domain-containing protein [Priestia flexa]AQX53469.1 general stress protein [Priestia flexa]MBN8250722.1 YtxH domain-containing protein [Priestia flexa]MBN8435970.1 YtxH domain-containing protein [Priestia flexa]MCA0968581.1 YtxH domain-containing protein [Priestia flexa]MCA1200971.1 YtxH domain-containing protein [Priestia flexa]